MRIISGNYKGRTLKGFDIAGTRPTMDRVKESLFAMIQRELKGSICLDLFAGSGNLGLEAISNGTQLCYFVDHNPIAIKTIKENIQTLKVGSECQVLKMDYLEALRYFDKKEITFDLIFLDPPYQMHVIKEILEFIVKTQLLNPGGLVICEYDKEEFTSDSLTLIKERNYGSKSIKIYKNC